MIVLIFALLLFIGAPIAFVLGSTSLFYLISLKLPLVIMPQRIYIGLESFLIVAVPLFILAGAIMNAGGITPRLVKLSNLFIKGLRGGLAYVTVVASMLFAGITGVGTADTAAIGSIMIPAMEKAGYKREDAAAIAAASGIIGPIIPPSVVMVIYASMANVSIAKLFMGGFIPGILLGVAIMVVGYLHARKHNIRYTTLDLPKNTREYIEGILALLMPVVILGGILGGVFTATEAAAFAVIYALILGLFVTRELKPRDIFKVFREASVISGGILMIIACAALFGWILAGESVPEKVGTLIISLTNNKYLILLLVNLFLIFLGMFMETLASVVLTLPILLPLMLKIGVDPVHFGIIMAVNLTVGLITPPLGVCAFVAASIAKLPFEKVVRSLVPYIIVTTIVLFIIVYFPKLVMFLPNLILIK